MPPDNETPQHEAAGESWARQEQESHQRRVEALRALAGSSTGGPANAAPGEDISVERLSPPSARRRPVRMRWRWWYALLIAVIVLGTLGGLALYRHSQGASQAAAKPLQIGVIGGGLDCPHDLAWSPDGRLLAIVGYQTDCPILHGPTLSTAGSGGIAPAVGLVKIYSAGNGLLVNELHPDAFVKSAIKIPAAVAAYEQTQEAQTGGTVNYFDVNYTHILWSRDGRLLALTFSVFVPTAVPNLTSNASPTWPGEVIRGVLIMTTAGVSPRVLLQPDSDPAAYVSWDLTTGEALPTPPSLVAAARDAGVASTVAPAASYRWGAGGQLTAQGVLAPGSGTPGTIGNPDGGEAFTPWQPGMLVLSSSDPSQPQLADVVSFTTDIAAWSPDGRYIATGIAIGGPLVAGQTPAGASGSLPVRDAGLRQSLSLAVKDPFQSPLEDRGDILPPGVVVAWRPDGRLLAISTARADHAVMVYDCASGRVVATLTPPVVAPFTSLYHPGKEQGELNVLRWSPDGTHLGLLDTSVGVLTIWNLSMLPNS